jgi:hypothetical protein
MFVIFVRGTKYTGAYGRRRHLTMLLQGVLGGPFSGRAIVAGPVGLEQLGNVRNQGIVGIGVGEERTNREEDFGNGQRGAPLVLQNVEANAAVRINVAVINAGGEMHFGGLRALHRRTKQEEDKRLEQ